MSSLSRNNSIRLERTKRKEAKRKMKHNRLLTRDGKKLCQCEHPLFFGDRATLCLRCGNLLPTP